MVKIP